MNAHGFRSVFRRRNLVPLTSACLLLLVAVCGCVVSRAQESSTPEGGREVVDKIPKHLPIKVKVKKPEKLKDAKNEEWLGELELEVTNTGTKPIYFLEIVLDLPDVFAPNGINIAYRLDYGRSELISLREPLRPDDVPIPPGEVAVLSVPANLAETWKRVRAKGTLANPKKIEFFFYFINFGDGTGFVTRDGKPLPERKERSATCAGGDSAGEAASVTSPPRYHFPEIASLVTLLPPPANLVPAFFMPKRPSPEPGAAQDLCCASGCSRLIASQDQGCPCPGVTRRTVKNTSCSDPEGSCGTVGHQTMPACDAQGVVHFCEEYFIEPSCAPTPTPTPTPCTPTEPQPNPCCTPEFVTPDPNLSGFCRWNCRAAETGCEGNRLDNGCYVVGGPVADCDERYGAGWTYSSTLDGLSLCCPPAPECPSATIAPCIGDDNSPAPGPTDPNSQCCWDSPVLIDVRGDGFSLTDSAAGVFFDFNGDGRRSRYSWTSAGSDDAFLALDRNGNGAVDDASELFGNRTAQPPTDEPNGFLALAEFDKAERGGNADGLIDALDAVFASLRLWQDLNHDGLSQAEELHTLQSLDVVRLHLDYKESKRMDAQGNRFRYRAKVDDAKGAKAGRWAWDVFLVSAR
jgi:hypothetical protein